MTSLLRCPRIYSHGTSLLLRYVGKPELAEQVGLDPKDLADPDGSVPLVLHYDLVEAAVEATGDALLGLHFSAVDMGEARPGAGTIGMLYFASPTLRVSIEKLVEHQASWNPGERYDFGESGDEFYLRYRCWGPSRPAHVQQALRNAASVVGVEKLVEGDLKLRSARFEMPQPSGAEEIEATLGCPVEFDAGINEFVLPLEKLDLPLPGADPELVDYCERQIRLQRAESLEAPSYTVLARRELEREDLSTFDDLAPALASRLACSERTLQRRLSEEGTSVRGLVDEARRERAIELLRSPFDVQQVAHELGYAEVSSFRRAFQRWFNQSPSVWRRRFAANGIP